jgi:succinylarginine dihydrolase
MSTPRANEINFDGLVGPTHNFSGLSMDNLAAVTHQGLMSSPRKAALQGLGKMRRLMELGLLQGVLPPHERPHLPTLRRLGFSGTDMSIIHDVLKIDPSLLINTLSASAMWAANAATVSPSSDTTDGRVHITPANLGRMFHRSLELGITSRVLKEIFSSAEHFVHHDPLPYAGNFDDEGAANHMRLCASYDESGVEVFVYGRSAFDANVTSKTGNERHFTPRQARESSESIIRLHRLNRLKTVLIQQSQRAINAGAFHNDVVAVSNRNIIFAHEHSFEEQSKALEEIQKACAFDVNIIVVKETDITLDDAVKTYLFNGQLITAPTHDGKTVLILPSDVKENTRTHEYIAAMCGSNNPINEVIFVDLKESMNNGGGPACLRLRIVLTDEEYNTINKKSILDESRLQQLESLVNNKYRDRFLPNDIADPDLITENYEILDKCTQILGLGSVYSFQMTS